MDTFVDFRLASAVAPGLCRGGVRRCSCRRGSMAEKTQQEELDELDRVLTRLALTEEANLEKASA